MAVTWCFRLCASAPHGERGFPPRTVAGARPVALGAPLSLLACGPWDHAAAPSVCGCPLRGHIGLHACFWFASRAYLTPFGLGRHRGCRGQGGLCWHGGFPGVSHHTCALPLALWPPLALVAGSFRFSRPLHFLSSRLQCNSFTSQKKKKVPHRPELLQAQRGIFNAVVS